MEFLAPEIDAYVVSHTDAEPALLNQLNRETNMNVLYPRMLSGHLQGRVLSMMAKMIAPSSILEIGTYTGYSAICLAEGLQEGGTLYTIDINEELEPMVRQYFEQAGIADRTDFRIGNAVDIIPDLPGGFDLVFIDADKENYSNYYDLVIDRMNPGGFIIADNVLWSGKVIDEAAPNDRETQALQAYSQKVQDDDRVENVLFPVRDGLLVARKR